MEEAQQKQQTAEELKSEYEQQIAAELLEVANYRKALEEEFAGKDMDDPEVAIGAKKKIMELVPDAGKNIKWLLNHAESEHIRKDLSKWIMELAMKAHEKSSGDDVLSKLLKELNSPVVTTLPSE
jgi:hypothetical protein